MTVTEIKKAMEAWEAVGKGGYEVAVWFKDDENLTVIEINEASMGKQSPDPILFVAEKTI
jgi:hypothetical protein